MITTKARAKVGQTTYQANGARWDGDDLRDVASGEYKTLPAAKLAARSWLRKGAEQFTIWRGTYDAWDIPDEAYGLIRDADWQCDENWVVNGWGDGDGGIEWTEETW